MEQVPYNKYLKEIDKQLKDKGLFLTTGHKEVNTMVIGWGGVNIYWKKPIFIVPVRKSRYTHGILGKIGEFSVNIPLNRDLSKELAFCGSKSGKDYDKFKECGLTPIEGQKIKAPIIKECNLHYECKVVYKQDLNPENLDPAIIEDWYPDYHTLFFGEIVACYKTD